MTWPTYISRTKLSGEQQMTHSKETNWPMLKRLNPSSRTFESFESALRDQTTMASAKDIAIARMSSYCIQENSSQQANRGNARTSTYSNYNDSDPKQVLRQVSSNYSSQQHGVPGMSSCLLKWPTWGQTCSNCGKPNHLSRVCKAKSIIELSKKPWNKWSLHGRTHRSHLIQPSNWMRKRDNGNRDIPFSPNPDPKNLFSNHREKWISLPTMGPLHVLGD